MTVGALAGSALLLLLAAFSPESGWALGLVAGAVAGVPLAAVALAGASLLLIRPGTVRRRRWAGLLVAALLLGSGHLALLGPLFLGDVPRGTATTTLLELNLRQGGAEPAAVVAAIDGARAELVVLAEVTPASWKGLEAAGIGRLLPYRAGTPEPGTAGTLVLSRWPIQGSSRIGVSNGAVLTRIDAPRGPLWLAGVHLAQPLRAADPWLQDFRALKRSLAPLTGPVIVAGDFNATWNHRPFRELGALGLRDAVDQANAGWQPTWPRARPELRAVWPLFGLVGIDHVLTGGGVVALGVSRFPVEGSDHLGLVVPVRWESAATMSAPASHHVG